MGKASEYFVRNEDREITLFNGSKIEESDWERIGYGPRGASELFRTSVIGGWLVMSSETGPDRETLVFVPDPLNAWRINDD